MYYDEFFPFYLSYADSEFCRREQLQEREYELMRSWLPEEAAGMQERIRKECELLDYEGSRIYDEYPDRRMLRRDYERICEKLQEGEGAGQVLQEVLFWQEISRRRCRRQRCRNL